MVVETELKRGSYSWPSQSMYSYQNRLRWNIVRFDRYQVTTRAIRRSTESEDAILESSLCGSEKHVTHL